MYACVLLIYTPPQLLTGSRDSPRSARVCYGSVCVMDSSTCLLLSVGVAVVSACRCGCIVANNCLCEADCFVTALINMRLFVSVLVTHLLCDYFTRS